MEIGEAFVGEGAEAAHLNTVLGPRAGPVGTAWATALATPDGRARALRGRGAAGASGQTPHLVREQGRDRERATRAPHLGRGAGRRGERRDGRGRGRRDRAASDVDELVLIAAVWVDPAARRRAGGLPQQPRGDARGARRGTAPASRAGRRPRRARTPHESLLQRVTFSTTRSRRAARSARCARRSRGRRRARDRRRARPRRGPC